MCWAMHTTRSSRRSRTAPPAPATGGEPQLGPVLDFMRVLWAVDHRLQSASKRMQASLGLTGPQRLAVRIIGRYPEIGAGRLAAILHVHPSTLTGILRRLEKAGLVARGGDERDGRRAVFNLTAQGRSIDRGRQGTVEAKVRSALERQPASRVAAAQRLLADLADSIDDEG